jgi:hypothetical protein
LVQCNDPGYLVSNISFRNVHTLSGSLTAIQIDCDSNRPISHLTFDSCIFDANAININLSGMDNFIFRNCQFPNFDFYRLSGRIASPNSPLWENCSSSNNSFHGTGLLFTQNHLFCLTNDANMSQGVLADYIKQLLVSNSIAYLSWSNNYPIQTNDLVIGDPINVLTGILAGTYVISNFGVSVLNNTPATGIYSNNYWVSFSVSTNSTNGVYSSVDFCPGKKVGKIKTIAAYRSATVLCTARAVNTVQTEDSSSFNMFTLKGNVNSIATTSYVTPFLVAATTNMFPLYFLPVNTATGIELDIFSKGHYYTGFYPQGHFYNISIETTITGSPVSVE